MYTICSLHIALRALEGDRVYEQLLRGQDRGQKRLITQQPNPNSSCYIIYAEIQLIYTYSLYSVDARQVQIRPAWSNQVCSKEQGNGVLGRLKFTSELQSNYTDLICNFSNSISPFNPPTFQTSLAMMQEIYFVCLFSLFQICKASEKVYSFKCVFAQV